MLLEPEGFITPHVDTFDSKLSPINMALNHPKGCLMKMTVIKGMYLLLLEKLCY